MASQKIRIYVEKLGHFTSYFRSLFNQNDHPKFVKAAQLANKIHQILPLRNSLENILEKLHQSGTEQYVGTDEQIIKSFVLEPPHVLCDKPGCDVKLLNQIRWGPKHSDSSSIHNRLRESHESSTVDHPLSEQQERKYQKLIHPTVGVLTFCMTQSSQSVLLN
ncbi:hypothetical protein H4Q26_007844 [Puccinia striiformis f. sp. tritici PST-130]|nr:hypothetical protein H4Q26_007844 [Puccinia striiformis f. sp. tritici PST-130]